MRHSHPYTREGWDLLAYAAAVFALGFALAVATGAGVAQASEPTPAPAPVTDECYEDDPCWSCETMGNGICGEPTPTPTLAPDAYADGEHQPPIGATPTPTPTPVAPVATLPDTAMAVWLRGTH